MDFVGLPACIERRYRQKRKKVTRPPQDRVDVGGESPNGSSADTNSAFSTDSQVARGSQENADDEQPTYFIIDFSDWDEDKLLEAMDLSATSKSAPVRLKNLKVLIKTFRDQYCIDFLMARPTTIADMLEKANRKAKGEEQMAVAQLAAILVLQYGPSPHALEVYDALANSFISGMMDKAVPLPVREKLVESLALMAFVTQNDPYIRMKIMHDLKLMFTGSYLFPDGGVPNLPANLASFHKTALLAWVLLLTVSPDKLAIVDNIMEPISGMLESPHVDLRIATGECLATMFELGREREEDFEGDDMDKLSGTLHMLANDSHRYRSKKDRRVQRASFRDIGKSINEPEGPPDLEVSFGVEKLAIQSWEVKRTYDAVRGILEGGIKHHLQFNPDVRNLFNLGDVIVSKKRLPPKLTKLERKMCNLEAERERFKRMGKKRDKRFDLLEEESD